MTSMAAGESAIAPPSQMFLDLETHGGRNVALSYVLVLDGPLTTGEVREAVDVLKALNPRLRNRVVRNASGIDEWAATDVEGQLDFVDLPPDSDVADVLERCSTLQDRVFPLDRQLWHVVYYSGLRGGRSALLVRLHHAVGNGAEAQAMLTLAFGAGREPVAVPGTRRDAPTEDDAEHRSRHQQVGVSSLGSANDWRATAAGHGVEPRVVFISLIADAMLRYRNQAGPSSDTVTVVVPTVSETLSAATGGVVGIHLPMVAVNRGLLGSGHLPELATKLATEVDASERRTLEMIRAGMAADSGAAEQQPADDAEQSQVSASPETADVLATVSEALPAMAVAGRRVVDFSSFAPVVGGHVVASLIEYDDQITVCTNLDESVVAANTFAACMRDAVSAVGVTDRR
ncbi:wax ester/triacylglycerol synthase domain-containing protein [Mycolicibacterium sp. CBM1]